MSGIVNVRIFVGIESQIIVLVICRRQKIMQGPIHTHKGQNKLSYNNIAID